MKEVFVRLWANEPQPLTGLGTRFCWLPRVGAKCGSAPTAGLEDASPLGKSLVRLMFQEQCLGEFVAATGHFYNRTVNPACSKW